VEPVVVAEETIEFRMPEEIDTAAEARERTERAERI
jgi:hypothetical protein